MDTNIKILLFKLQNCEPCTQLTEFINTEEVKQIKSMVTEYMAPKDLHMFKAKRVSGAPQMIIMQGEIELHRAKGFDDCVDLIKRVLEDDF